MFLNTEPYLDSRLGVVNGFSLGFPLPNEASYQGLVLRDKEHDGGEPRTRREGTGSEGPVA